jgi:hypothetical protein
LEAHLRRSLTAEHLIDGLDSKGLAGWRGVISTDKFYGLSTVHQVLDRGSFRIPRGTPIIRALPIPRELLHAPVAHAQG